MADLRWFHPEHYRAQVPASLQTKSNLSLRRHYARHGWKQGLAPHPLFDPVFYVQRCLERGIPLAESPLDHFLRWGCAAGLLPSALMVPEWMAKLRIQLVPDAEPSLAELHPAGAAALFIQENHLGAAAHQLARWMVHGISPAETSVLEKWRMPEAALAPSGNTAGSKKSVSVRLFGLEAKAWPAHLWIQWLPWGDQGGHLEHSYANGVKAQTRWGLLLEPLATGAKLMHDVAGWAALDVLWVPAPLLEPGALELLQALGVPARQLSPGTTANGWLDQPELVEQAECHLGLPRPQALAPGVMVCGGNGSAHQWSAPLPEKLWHLPGFDALTIKDAVMAQSLAAWLQRCHLTPALQLVRLAPRDVELRSCCWEAVASPSSPLILAAPATPAEILRLLDPETAALSLTPTPTPPLSLLWNGGHGGRAVVSVCISLHNYGHCVVDALESCLRQSLEQLELIVVDDASSDGGEAVVQRWLDKHGQHFSRALLLRHECNAGLAAARNTAFAEARTPWCFVLDADNQLDNDALACCWDVGTSSAAHVAVVHPLIRSHGTWHRTVGWQREALVHGNVIDAMALVRRNAWQAVGGYRAIPGGWEDFDFWCQLIDAGFTGVLCPRPLASYTVHDSSMLATSTNGDQHRLSTLLQALHPWLDLPLSRQRFAAQQQSVPTLRGS